MRIISQDGTIDMPYEAAKIYILDSVIKADFAGRDFTLAIYSSNEKAEKAMGMVHEEWICFEGCSIYQFPKDDEV